MMRTKRWVALAAGLAMAAVPLAACSSSSDSTAEASAAASAAAEGGAATGEPVKLGVTMTVTGGLSVFQPVLQAGYEAAVADINAAGGVTVDGEQRPLELVIKDNKSDPAEVTAVAKSLVYDDGVVALLGSVSPPMNIPLSNVAEQEQVPALVTTTPTMAWLGGNANGWKYSWDVFIDEKQQTTLNFLASDMAKTNKKVALFTDTEEDGEAMGGLWEATAGDFGYEVVYRAKFPVGTTDFSQYIREAQAADAEIVISQMIPPDAIALWKQMKSLQYQPVVAYAEKSGSFGWNQALGPDAEGTSVMGWYSPAKASPESKAVYDRFAGTFGDGLGAQAALATYSLVQIVADAINRAGSADPAAINDALGQTKDLPTAIGPITFGANHAAVLPAVMMQWQGDKQVVVYPAEDANGEFVFPVPGLAKS